MNVIHSTFDANIATGSGSPSYPGAAAIMNNYANLTVANSIFMRGNLNAGGSGKLGGIATNAGPALILNSTIANNTNGGVWTSYFGFMTLKNTIVAGNEGANCYGATGDGGHNLTSDSTCFFFPQNNSLSNVDPLFDPGALTLQAGSPAIDAGNDSVCAAAPVNNVDFLGVARPKGPHCDMGAYEPDRGTLVVINQVINDDGGTKSASDLTVNVSAVNSSSFPGAEAPGTTVGIAPGSYSVTVTGNEGYDSSPANCSGTIADNQTVTCTFMHDDIPPPPAGFTFTGFFSPVDNPPTVNVVKAGGAVPIKFSLGGDQGLDILAEGYPASHEIDCSSDAPRDPIEETATTGNNSLTYDPDTDTYTYVWKTAKAWAGTCRKLVVRLSDGSDHKANFRFK
jgi:hypothetical protein